MPKKVLAKIFYTPVRNPENIECIEVDKEEDLKIISGFVRRIVYNKTKKPGTPEPQFSEKMLIDIMEKGLDVNLKDVERLFESLSNYMYGKAKSKEKYWCLIATREFTFIYHFTPEEAISFEERTVREFIKYLDDASILRFLFKLKSKDLSLYFKEVDIEELQISAEASDYKVYGSYEKRKSKGFMRLVGEEPEYEFKGNLSIRIKRSDKTDIVVETFIDDLQNINSNVYFDFERETATIKIEDAPITELIVGNSRSKYTVKTGLRRIEYEKLGIGEFIHRYEFYKGEETVYEEKYYVKIGEKRLDKPENELLDKEETIFILGDEEKVEYGSLIKDASDSIRNNFNVGFVELSKFDKNYLTVHIGHFAIFARFKEDMLLNNLEDIFGILVKEISENLTLMKTIHYIGLLSISKFLKSQGFKKKLYEIGKRALDEYFISMPKKNIELKELDELGIEFKAGRRADRLGFFDPSPMEQAKRIEENARRKSTNFLFYFIGINEDTRDFSPIPLSMIRNEFHASLKRALSKRGLKVLASETIPISEKDGILVVVVHKSS